MWRTVSGRVTGSLSIRWYKVGLGSDDEESIRGSNRCPQGEAEIPAVGDVGHTDLQHLEQGFLLVRFARVYQEMGWDQAVQLQTEMQANRPMSTRVFGPQHGGYRWKE